jgi:uridine kinase
MAIRILLDHGVQQEKIVFVTMLVAKPGGIAVLRKAFPDVKFVCGGVDEQLKESWLEFTDEAGIRKRRKAWITSPGTHALV